MWATLSNDATSDDDGGFNSSSVTIDKSKKYRYSIWIKRENIGDGRTYFGCGGSTVSSLGTSETVNGNPYFVNYIPTEKIYHWNSMSSYSCSCSSSRVYWWNRYCKWNIRYKWK